MKKLVTLLPLLLLIGACNQSAPATDTAALEPPTPQPLRPRPMPGKPL
jgi:hypothetical protein